MPMTRQRVCLDFLKQAWRAFTVALVGTLPWIEMAVAFSAQANERRAGDWVVQGQLHGGGSELCQSGYPINPQDSTLATM